jgi:hypothetical protein
MRLSPPFVLYFPERSFRRIQANQAFAGFREAPYVR